MNQLWLSENSLEQIKASIQKRGYDLGNEIGEGKGSVVFDLINNSTLCCKIRPYSKEAVRRIYYSRAAYCFDKKRFPYLPIPDPNRSIEFVLNSDELTDDSKDWEVEPIITKDRAYLATIHERLSPIRSFNERELLKMTIDIAEALDNMYDPLRFALHGINRSDILFSYLIDRYVLSDCSKVSRFTDHNLRFRYGDPTSSAPELSDYLYYETSSVYALGCVLREIAAQGVLPEKEVAEAIGKVNSAVSPALVLLSKKELTPLDDKNSSKYSGGFIRLINRMTAFYPADRLTPPEVAEVARQLRALPAHLREEVQV